MSQLAVRCFAELMTLIIATHSNVFSMMSMSEYVVLDGNAPNLREVDPKMGKQYLSILAPPGLAAHVGLFDVAKLTKGDVVMVSSAAGATGGLCVQMAKKVGAAKIIGIASSRKCQSVIDNGADECIAYNEEGFEEKLKKATEGKVSVYFENVGGHVLDAALPCMAPFGRIAVCGMIADYDRLGSDEGFNAVKNLRYVLTARLRMEGFICAQRGEKALNTALKELAEWAAEGTLHTEVHTHPQKGVEHCIDALKALLKGGESSSLVTVLLRVEADAKHPPSPCREPRQDDSRHALSDSRTQEKVID